MPKLLAATQARVLRCAAAHVHCLPWVKHTLQPLAQAPGSGWCWRKPAVLVTESGRGLSSYARLPPPLPHPPPPPPPTHPPTHPPTQALTLAQFLLLAPGLFESFGFAPGDRPALASLLLFSYLIGPVDEVRQHMQIIWGGRRLFCHPTALADAARNQWNAGFLNPRAFCFCFFLLSFFLSFSQPVECRHHEAPLCSSLPPSPVQLLGWGSNVVSRRFEYQADAFAVGLGHAQPLRDALCALDKENKVGRGRMVPASPILLLMQAATLRCILQQASRGKCTRPPCTSPDPFCSFHHSSSCRTSSSPPLHMPPPCPPPPPPWQGAVNVDPLYSSFHHSHPPLLERLAAIDAGLKKKGE